MAKTRFLLLAICVLAPYALAQVPVLQVSHEHSSVKFNVKSSVKIAGHFEKWTSTMTLSSPDVTSGVLDIEIQASSVTTGSGMKDKTLKGKDFFYADENPLITFKSTSIVQTGPMAFEIPGTFTIRGVSEPETLKMTLHGPHGTGSEQIKGAMVFDRKKYGMNSGIPFVKIGDHVEVDLDLRVSRVSGPALVFKQ